MRRLILLILLLALLAAPASSLAQPGIELSHAVSVYRSPHAQPPASRLALPLGCRAVYPLMQTLNTAGPEAAPVVWYRLRTAPHRTGWVRERFTRRVVYRNPHCGQLAGDLAPPPPGPARRRFTRLVHQLRLVSDALGRPLFINGGYRTRAEQAALYSRFLSGSGAAANSPGHSAHEIGGAADVIFGRVRHLDRLELSVGRTQRARRAMQRLGMCLPHPAEPWHVEMCH